MIKTKSKLLFMSVIILAFVLRFYRLGEFPLGFHQDEISQAYNSFSILKTGHDRYGEFTPILFRSFGSYQPPIYTYITPIPLYFFGNTAFAARFASAFFGVLSVVITFFIVNILANDKYKQKLAVLSSFVIAISPWAIHFSRRVVEGNLGLTFFLIALLFFLKSLKKIKYLLLAFVFLGLSTHAYYSERLIAVLFAPVFLVSFKEYFLKYKKYVFLSLMFFGFILSPHIVTVFSGAFTARLDQVGTAGSGTSFFIEFIKHFVQYFSPTYLFGDAGNGLARVSPGLGVFYSWMFIPFLAGLYFLAKFLNKRYIKLLTAFLIISLVPASLTGDIFYPLRALEFFWMLAVIIAIGIFQIGQMIRNNSFKWVIFVVVVSVSLIHFYVSYFVLFQYESTESAGNTYITLSNKLNEYKDSNIVLDSSRDPAIGLRIAFLRGYDPKKMQTLLKSQMQSPYYSKVVNNNEIYIVEY